MIIIIITEFIKRQIAKGYKALNKEKKENRAKRRPQRRTTSYSLGKRWVFRAILKAETLLEFLIGMGRLFHNRGAAMEKALSPACLCVLWTARDLPSEERRE